MKSTIKNYLSGKSSTSEQREILDWIRKDQHLAEFQETKSEWKNEVVKEEIPSEFKPNWLNIQNNMLGQMQVEMQHTQRSLKFFRYAAIFILLISVSSLVYFFTQSKPSSQLVYTTVVADYGQISKVVLPDSSVIWINSGSTIKYNNQFSSTNRDIELIGEAFFKVHKNKELPLIVSSSELQVKVLGTEFGVMAYPEESVIQVVLEKGKVELTSLSELHLKQVMKPGELASFDKASKALTTKNINTTLYTSWKDGITNIYNLPLSEVVIRLEKRFNQKFIVDDDIKNMPYTYTIKNENLNSILTLMEKITPIYAVQKNNVIELKRSKAKKTKGKN